MRGLSDLSKFRISVSKQIIVSYHCLLIKQEAERKKAIFSDSRILINKYTRNDRLEILLLVETSND